MTTKAKQAKEPTTYTILERIEVTPDDEGTITVWREAGEQDGPNEAFAIKAFAGVEGTGTFKGVPKRSWSGGLIVKPVTQTEATPL